MDNFIGYPAKLSDCVLSLREYIGDYVIVNCSFNIPKEKNEVYCEVGKVLNFMNTEYFIQDIEFLDTDLVYGCKIILK